MKKFILVVFVVFALSISVLPVLAEESSNELFTDGDYKYNVQRQGNNITLTSTVPKIPRMAGIPNLVGTITGTTFSGKVYLVADDCPNLDGYVPASGTVSKDGSSITVTYNTTDYYYKTCVEKANSESEVRMTYSIASAVNASSAPTSQPTQSSAESIPSDPNKFAKYLAQYRINVEDEAKKIVSIKECGGGLPSQNACIAEKLNSIDITVARIDSFPIDIKPVILGKDANREIVGFQQENIPASVDLLDVTSAGIIFDKESASAPENGTRNAVIFKGEMMEVYTPEGQWKPVIVGSTPVRPESTIVTAPGGVMYYSQLNVVGGVGQTSYMTFGGTQTDAASTQAKYDKLFYDLKFGSATFDTSKSDKNVEVRTPLTITRSKNTKFAVLYDPEKLYAATIIYEGEVEVIDILSDKTMILKPTDGGKPRMAIVPLVKAEEKTQAAEPASKAQSKSSIQSKSSGKNWILIFILILVIIIVGGLVLYKRDMLKKGLLKKDVLKKLFPTRVGEQEKK